MILTFLGTGIGVEVAVAGGDCGFGARQLLADTLVAVVETLRVLALLYRVKADVDVPALEVVLNELRQLPETIELELEATARWLRVELGDTARSEPKSESNCQWSDGG
jgi:hypothetical protein